jgi:hypothetical protein
MQLEHPSKALEDFNRAADLDENNSDVYHHRGQVHYMCLFLTITLFKLCVLLQHNTLNIKSYGTKHQVYPSLIVMLKC